MRPPAMLRRSLVALAIVTSGAVVGTTVAAAPPAPTPAHAPAPRAAAPPLSSTSIAGYRSNITAGTNQHRARAGIGGLRFNRALTLACQWHAQDMARHRRMSHTGTDGSNGGQRATRYGFRWSAWGENIAAGYTSSASVVSAWMNSAGHRANMLNRNFTYIGIGAERASNGTIYYCMLLGR